MHVGPDIAAAAALLGDPARAAMIALLVSGDAYPATVLAASAGISAQTASVHLAKLTAGGIVNSTKSGRHRLYRLDGPKVAAAFEALAAISSVRPIRSLHQSDESKAMSTARMCYDHVAGYVGVAITNALGRVGALSQADRGYVVSRRGRSWFSDFGIDVDTTAQSKRKFATQCLDWSERRPHVGGALGAALAERMLRAGWFTRRRTNRSLIVTDSGWKALNAHFGIEHR
jgi:DNA-binding transcriptional ArsR family regulator